MGSQNFTGGVCSDISSNYFFALSINDRVSAVFCIKCLLCSTRVESAFELKTAISRGRGLPVVLIAPVSACPALDQISAILARSRGHWAEPASTERVEFEPDHSFDEGPGDGDRELGIV
jgi:hypothetical protein